MLAIVPEKKYSEDNELEYREDVRRRLEKTYQKTGDLTVPFGKSLAFTSAQGQVITFGYNEEGNFTIQQDASTPFGLASLSFVSTVQSDLESSFASLETSLTADFGDLEASFTTIATAFADIETAFASLEVEVEAANDAAAAAATSALAAYASETAAGSSAGAAATSATSAATQASNAATSATQASTSETNAAGSAATATTQATNAANSATAAGGSASAAAGSASTASTQATNAGNSATASQTAQVAAESARDAASGSAGDASTSASAAAGSASTASTQASNAATSASAANTSATSAATQASNAATSASAASSSAGAASTSASQASTSESNAAGSASAAATSATNAATSATSAGNSASAASTSASTASTQATNAGTSASNAATSASDAATSASAAGSSASAASTSASSASTSASNAATSASSAQSSSVSARVAAASAFPSTFDNRTLFTETIYGLTPTPFSESDSRFSSVSGEGIVYTTDGDAAAIAGLVTFRPVAGRTYKVTARVRVTINPTVRTTDTYVGFHTMDANGASVTYSGTSNYSGIVAADGWRNLSHTVTGDTLLTLGALARPITLLNWNDGFVDGSGLYYTDSTMQAAYLKFEDITESTTAGTSAAASASSASSAAASQSAAASSASAASTSATNAATQASNAATSASQASTSETNAAGSASTASSAATNAASSQSAAAGSATAASGSASTASTQAGNAATSASAAATSATSAATQASNASTSASSASTSAGNAASSATSAATQASNAAGSASSASSSASAASASATSAASSATLSATFAAGSQGSINSSATFADNANATGVPTNWSDWSNGSGTRVTGIAPQPYAFTLVGGAGASAGIYSPLTDRIATGWHVLEVDVTLNSGALTGAGVYLDWNGGGDILSFSVDTDINGAVIGAGTAGQLYRFRKLIQVTKGSSYNGMYAMSHWSGGSFGSVASTNSITWHRCALRVASQAEIEARQAKLDLVTANANIASNAAASASNAASIASLSTTVSANFTTATRINKNLIPNSTGLKGMAGWTNPGAWGTYSHPLWGQWFYRGLTGVSGLTESFYTDEFVAYPGWRYYGSLVPYVTGITAGSAYSQIVFYNSSHAYIGEANLSLTSGMTYNRATFDGVAPAGTAYARFAVYLVGVSGDAGYAEIGFWQAKAEFNGSTAWRADEELSNGLSRLSTAEAAIVTNASAIATESSARAAADTTLTASLGTTNANVSTQAAAIVTLEGAAAVWEVVAAASGGTPARVGVKTGLGGSTAWIDASKIFFGDNTTFEDPYNSFYTEASSKRFRFGGPFPASGDMVMWFGPTSVALNSETKTNGYFCFATDGKVYYGASELAANLTATASPASSTVTHGAGVFSTGSITITPVGGSGHTYAWDVVKTSGAGAAPTMSSYTNASSTASCTLSAGQDVQGFIRCTVTASGGHSTSVIIPFSFNETS